MAENLPKKHFLFPSFGDAHNAMEKWWENQDQRGVPRTGFDISAAGRTNDISISDQSLAAQDEFLTFLAINFAGKYTLHDAQQVRTGFDGVFGG